MTLSVGTLVFIAPVGEMPKAEGEALVVYFAMNISSVPGHACSKRLDIKVHKVLKVQRVLRALE